MNAGNILKRFDKAMTDDPLFAGAFSPAEVADIRQTLTTISKYPVMGPVGGAMFGSGPGIGAGSAGYALGMDARDAAGLTAAVTWLLPLAFSTSTGRSLVRGLAEHGQLWSHTGVKALTAFGRGAGRAGGQELTEGESGGCGRYDRGRGERRQICLQFKEWP